MVEFCLNLCKIMLMRIYQLETLIFSERFRDPFTSIPSVFFFCLFLFHICLISCWVFFPTGPCYWFEVCLNLLQLHFQKLKPPWWSFESEFSALFFMYVIDLYNNGFDCVLDQELLIIMRFFFSHLLFFIGYVFFLRIQLWSIQGCWSPICAFPR